MIKFPSIEQFRNVIRNVEHTAQYVGQNPETGEPMYNRGAKLPVIVVTATEKLHGTNMAVCFSIPGGFWVQSRENIITPESDNAACAFNAMQNKDVWISIISDLVEEYSVNLNTHIISVYAEWCGGNIQKNSAATGLDKMAVIFRHFKVSPIESSEDEVEVWHETKANGKWVDAVENRIYNISTFPTWEFSIDFNQPLMSQNALIELVEKTIEPNSPFGRQFGIDGNVGEGVVCTFMLNGTLQQFKVKGTAHSASKVKTLKPVDNEKLQKVQDVAQQVTPSWRLEQMFAAANDTINGGIPTMQNMGTFLKLLNQDILKEEADVIAEASLEPKEVFPVVAKIAREWYNEELNRLVFKQ
jgi:hypothetical protein